jgi:hypothetical protein
MFPHASQCGSQIRLAKNFPDYAASSAGHGGVQIRNIATFAKG